MLKTILIGFKDVKLVFRDRAALILMLAAPFLVTVGMALVTGRFSGNNNSGALNIPIAIVNLDNDSIGNALVEVFNSPELADLVEPANSSTAEAARALVDEDKLAAAIIIPAGFTQSVIPQNGNIDANAQIEFYANPARPTSAGIIKAVLDQFLTRLDEMQISGVVSITQLIASGKITPQEANQAGAELGKRLENNATNFESATAIKIKTSTAAGETNDFDPLAFFAPSMALMFLMYTVSYGGRSILAEKAEGTLPRLLVTPTTSAQILGGKVFGIFLTGAAQMFILIGATTLLFQLHWGDPLGVIFLVFAAVFGATGWGLFITALARTPAQVGSLGSALMLIFAVISGSFFQIANMPPFMQRLSQITPNAWALNGFETLALGGTLAALTTPIAALLTMGLILFLISAAFFGKKNLMQK